MTSAKKTKPTQKVPNQKNLAPGSPWLFSCYLTHLSYQIFSPPFSLGILMIIDIPQERGMSSIFSNWQPNMCHFPMFNFLHPASIEWMHVIYVIMLVGAIGILLGLFYRLSCIMYMITYWYIFLLDKGIWNNHSYLYGLVSIMLLLTDCNRYW